MKTNTLSEVIILIFILLFAVTVRAADMTITIPTADVPRVQEAYGSILNLGRPANINEVQRATTTWIHNSTLDYERRKNIATFSPPPMEMQPTPSPSPTPGGLAAGAKSAPASAPVTPTSTPVVTKATPTPKKR